MLNYVKYKDAYISMGFDHLICSVVVLLLVLNININNLIIAV